MRLTGGKFAYLSWQLLPIHLLIIWEGVVFPETALSHKRILHQNHRLILTVRKKMNGGNMTRSCKKCGFFVNIPTSFTKDIGYCLFFKVGNIERKDSRRKLKIIDGEENMLANDCEEYINTVDYF